MNKIEPTEPISEIPLEVLGKGMVCQTEKRQARARKRLKKIQELRAELQKPAKRQNEPRKTKQRARKGIPRRKPNEIQPFVEKILNIIEDTGYQSIFWNENGTRFVIDREHFERDFLWKSKEEKAPIQTTNYPSFIRQLNLYGFRKVGDIDRNYDHGIMLNHYEHKDLLFQRGKIEEMAKITRSGSVPSATNGQSNGFRINPAKRGPKSKPKNVNRNHPYGYSRHRPMDALQPLPPDAATFPPVAHMGVPFTAVPFHFPLSQIKQENFFPYPEPAFNGEMYYPGMSSDDQNSEPSPELQIATIKKEYDGFNGQH